MPEKIRFMGAILDAVTIGGSYRGGATPGQEATRGLATPCPTPQRVTNFLEPDRAE